jgi:hypothetical protein
MTARTPKALGATHTVFAHNLTFGGGRVAAIDGQNTDAIWGPDLVWQTGPLGHLPESAVVSFDPTLQPDAHGILRSAADRAALRAATRDFPFAMLDRDCQPRPAERSAGAHEESAAPPAGRIQTPTDVGPGAR